MSWYIHPSRQLRDDELPPELVVTNHDGSIEQAYVPYNASDKLEAENARLRELVSHLYECMCNVDVDGNHECDLCEYDNAESRCDFVRQMRELGVEVDE